MMGGSSAKRSNVHRALVFQGGGSLGAYEAGSYKAMSEELSVFLGKQQEGEEKKKEPVLFHIVSGTSIGAINAAILVSYVKENRTWQGSGQRLVDFWEYLSTHSNVDSMGAYFTNSWDYWRIMDSRVASGESARRYYGTKEFILKGVPNVFRPKTPKPDSRFFDPSNTWYVYDNMPLKQSLERFAKFPISTSFENREPRLLLVAVDIQEGVPVVFDSYEKEDGTRKSVYGRYYGVETDEQENEDDDGREGDFEHVIRYDDGITSDFVLASSSVPVNYEYTRLRAEDRKSKGYVHDGKKKGTTGSDRYGSSPISNSDVNLRFFWDGGLLANTPLRQTVIAHRNYWFRVRKMENNLPSLTVAIINLHPLKQEYVPYDYDGVVDRKNDIIYHDKTEFDEHAAILISDLQKLAASLVKLSKDNGASEESLQMILQQRIDSVSPITGRHLRCGDLLKARVDVNFVIRLQRNNDLHTISNKIFDFSDITIRQLIHDGYRETQPQVKRILSDPSLMPQDK
jgi:predicted acylesterase/phospholipase RssA